MENETIILLAEINAQIQNLDRITNILKSPKIPSTYRNTIHAKFNLAISPVGKKLTTLNDTVKAGKLDPETLSQCWSMIGEIRQECNYIYAQCMDFLGGIAIREMELERGMCQIAEHLVRDTYSTSGLTWSSVLIVGEERLYQEIAQTTQFIRLRFPELDVWSLPFTAHEFGMLLASTDQVRGIQELFADEMSYISRLIDPKKYKQDELVGVSPVLLELRKKHYTPEHRSQALERQRMHIKILFADMFATYFLGPAYVYARLFLRMEPNCYDQDRGYEPSFLRRFAIMHATLHKMNEREKSTSKKFGPYEDVLTIIKEKWDNTIRSVNPAYAGEFMITKPFNDWFNRLWEPFNTAYSLSGFQREDWELASDLGERLIKFLNEAEEVILPESVKLPVILNAAWYALAAQGLEDQVRIEKKVLQWCEQFVPMGEGVRLTGPAPSAQTGPTSRPEQAPRN